MTGWDEAVATIYELHEVESEWQTTNEVYDRVLKAAALFENQGFPAPRVLVHSTISVVFDWGGILMTISGSRAETLLEI